MTAQLVSVGDYERKAHKLLPHNALSYFKSGALNEVTLKENKTAMNR